MRGRERQMLSPSLGLKLETFPAAAPPAPPPFRLWFVVFHVDFIVFWSSKFPRSHVSRRFYRVCFGSESFLLDLHMDFHTPFPH